MNITSAIQDHFQVLAISGVIDASNAGQFEQAITGLSTDSIKGVILDLQNLEYMSSAGIREIIKAKRMLDSKNLVLAFCSLQPFLREVFDLAGLSDRLLIYGTIEDAIHAHS